MIHLVAITGVNGQIGMGGTVPWVGDETCMDLAAEFAGSIFAASRNDIWVSGMRSAASLQNLKRGTGAEAILAIQPPLHTAVEFRMGLEERWPGKDIWVMGGAKTFEEWMPQVDRHHILVVPYDGPADCFLQPLIPGWRIEGESVRRTPTTN